MRTEAHLGLGLDLDRKRLDLALEALALAVPVCLQPALVLGHHDHGLLLLWPQCECIPADPARHSIRPTARLRPRPLAPLVLRAYNVDRGIRHR